MKELELEFYHCIILLAIYGGPLSQLELFMWKQQTWLTMWLFIEGYMSLNIYRFIWEESRIDAILDCAYKNFMYSQGKQIIYIIHKGKGLESLIVVIVLYIVNTVMAQILIKWW